MASGPGRRVCSTPIALCEASAAASALRPFLVVESAAPACGSRGQKRAWMGGAPRWNSCIVIRWRTNDLAGHGQ